MRDRWHLQCCLINVYQASTHTKLSPNEAEATFQLPFSSLPLNLFTEHWISMRLERNWSSACLFHSSRGANWPPICLRDLYTCSSTHLAAYISSRSSESTSVREEMSENEEQVSEINSQTAESWRKSSIEMSRAYIRCDSVSIRVIWECPEGDLACQRLVLLPLAHIH